MNLFQIRLLIALIPMMELSASMIIPEFQHEIEDKYVKLHFQKSYGKDFRPGLEDTLELSKRGDFEVGLYNDRMNYMVQLELGSSSQKVWVRVDTGSSDLWVSTPTNPYCKTYVADMSPMVCNEFGTFNPNDSDTFHWNGTGFYIKYGDGTFAKGEWGYDKFMLGGISLNDFSFAVCDDTDAGTGILGLGFPELESSNTEEDSNMFHQRSYTYSNLPLSLFEGGYIKSYLYSLYLNQPSASYGSLLFGAVDISKFCGELNILPMVNTLKNSGYDHPIEFTVDLQGVDLKQDGKMISFPSSTSPVLLDSGTTISYLPSEMVKNIAEQIGTTGMEGSFYKVDCPADNDDTELYFNFGSFGISIPLSTFILHTGNGLCWLGISPISKSTDGEEPVWVLGDNFLRYAYVVYDLANYQIGMAQANFNSNKEDIKVITGSNIPLLSGAYCSTSSVTTTTIISGSNRPTSTSTSVSSSNSKNNLPTSIHNIDSNSKLNDSKDSGSPTSTNNKTLLGSNSYISTTVVRVRSTNLNDPTSTGINSKGLSVGSYESSNNGSYHSGRVVMRSTSESSNLIPSNEINISKGLNYTRGRIPVVTELMTTIITYTKCYSTITVSGSITKERINCEGTTGLTTITRTLPYFGEYSGIPTRKPQIPIIVPKTTQEPIKYGHSMSNSTASRSSESKRPSGTEWLQTESYSVPITTTITVTRGTGVEITTSTNFGIRTITRSSPVISEFSIQSSYLEGAQTTIGIERYEGAGSVNGIHGYIYNIVVCLLIALLVL